MWEFELIYKLRRFSLCVQESARLWQSARLAGKLLDPSSSPHSLTPFGADAQGQLNKPTIPNPHPTPALNLDKTTQQGCALSSPPPLLLLHRCVGTDGKDRGSVRE